MNAREMRNNNIRRLSSNVVNRSMANIRNFFPSQTLFLSVLWCLLVTTQSHAATSGVVNITEDLSDVVVEHRGIAVQISRVQDNEHRLVDDFSKTSRPCPPFCIHPMEAAPGVRTVGEIELLDFLSLEVSAQEGVLIDARMPAWYDAETIPGAVNIPFFLLTRASEKRNRILDLLGGETNRNGTYDFINAKKLFLFCNGPWCDQSTRAINGLIEAGYPTEKIVYYRGGMQMWKLFGLTTVLPREFSVEKELVVQGGKQ